MMIGIVLLSYVILSGPAGGVVYAGAEYSSGQGSDLFEKFWLPAYEWHARIFSPIILALDYFGLAGYALQYWLLCGWNEMYSC